MALQASKNEVYHGSVTVRVTSDQLIKTDAQYQFVLGKLASANVIKWRESNVPAALRTSAPADLAAIDGVRTTSRAYISATGNQKVYRNSHGELTVRFLPSVNRTSPSIILKTSETPKCEAPPYHKYTYHYDVDRREITSLTNVVPTDALIKTANRGSGGCQVGPFDVEESKTTNFPAQNVTIDLTFDVVATLDCNQSLLGTPLCTEWCLDHADDCFQRMNDYCFGESGDPTSDVCVEYFRSYLGNKDRPMRNPLSSNLASYCQSSYDSLGALHNNGSDRDKELCACHMPTQDYVDFKNDLFSAYPSAGNLSLAAANCFYPPCATTAFKTPSISASGCKGPQCFNITSFDISGRVDRSDITVNQETRGCGEIKEGEAPGEPGTNPPGGEPEEPGGETTPGGNTASSGSTLGSWLFLGGLVVVVVVVLLVILSLVL